VVDMLSNEEKERRRIEEKAKDKARIVKERKDIINMIKVINKRHIKIAKVLKALKLVDLVELAKAAEIVQKYKDVMDSCDIWERANSSELKKLVEIAKTKLRLTSEEIDLLRDE